MKVSIIQLEHNDLHTKSERIQNVSEIIKELCDTDLVMLPELWNTGFFSYQEYAKNSESIDGETISTLSTLAREKHTHIFTGSFVEKRGDKLYNSAVMIAPDGNILGRYSKIHLFGAEREYLCAGDSISTIDTEFGTVGMSICYDLRFPELYRKMNEPQILLSCYALPKERLKHWQILYPARALENQAISLSCGCCGTNRGVELSGHSMVINPYGEIKIEALDKGLIMNVDIDVNEVMEYRKSTPILRDKKLFI